MNAKFSQFNTINVVPQLTSKNNGLAALSVVRNPEGAIGIADDALTRLPKSRYGLIARKK